jgi:hypothetical protein
VFPVCKTFFYDGIEPHLEKVRLGPNAVAYTARSVEAYIKNGIKAATAAPEPAPAKRGLGRPRKHPLQLEG